jgi:glycosyltransferase involved in cell wall biosynthesis
MPRWSIVVTTYKRPERLRETLSRITEASRGVDAEILVADDDPEGSGRLPALEILAEHPGPSSYTCNPTNLGTVANVNAAIARSAGQLIHWCADDDWPEPGFYAAMGRPLENVVHCGYRNHLPDGTAWEGPLLSDRSEYLKRGAYALRLLYGNPTHMVATAFERGVWGRLGGFDRRFPLLHDWHFLLRAAAIGGAAFVPSRLANYTQQPASLTGTADPAAFEAEKQAMYADIQSFVSGPLP